MTTKREEELLPNGRDVPFGEIEATLARLVRDGRRRRRSPARAFTATVIVVSGAQRLAAAADALEQIGESAGVRAILISEGTKTSAAVRVTENTIAIAGLPPRFIDNAVAALRLSSLPSLVWWRGGSIDTLPALADLADRLVLDTEQPDDVWTHAPALFEHTALTDLRWAALTTWRAALAHLFDLPHVRGDAARLSRLSIEASDRPAARLYAGWLRASLGWKNGAALEIRDVKAEAPTPLARVVLSGGELSITLQVRESRTCLEAEISALGCARIVPLADTSLAALISQELAVRTRDTAFEQALVAAREIPA